MPKPVAQLPTSPTAARELTVLQASQLPVVVREEGITTNLDLSDPMHQRMLQRARRPDVPLAFGAVGEVFPTKWICRYSYKSEAKDGGEAATYWNLVLIAPDGRMIVSPSRHFAESLALVLAFRGLGPWDPPLKLKVVRASRGGEKGMLMVEETD